MRTKYFDTRLMSSRIHIILTVRKNLWSQFYVLGTCTEKCKQMSQNRFVLFSRLAECKRVRKLADGGGRDMMGSKADMISSSFPEVARQKIFEEFVNKANARTDGEPPQQFQINPKKLTATVAENPTRHRSRSGWSSQWIYRARG